MKPKWLEGTNLTRFDVPGLFNQIWHDSVGVACTDINQMAGCVLGGGIAVNSALWWKPNPRDWDFNFPEGWKNSDMAKATAKVFSRIPGVCSKFPHFFFSPQRLRLGARCYMLLTNRRVNTDYGPVD